MGNVYHKNLTGDDLHINKNDATIYPQDYATGAGTSGDPWAGNCIEDAYNAASDGDTVFLRAGYYELVDALVWNKAVNLIGEGIGITFIITADDNGLWFGSSANYITVQGFTIDGDAQTDNTSGLRLINVSDSDYMIMRDIEGKNAGWTGINLYQHTHCLFQNIWVHDCFYTGFHPGSDEAGKNTYNTYRDMYCYDNGMNGFDDRGTTTGLEQMNNVFDNIQTWGNGSVGFALGLQKGAIVTNCLVIENVDGYYGLYLYDLEDCIFTNVIVRNNFTGIRMEDCVNIIFNSCQSYDDNVSPVQNYGIELETCTGISVINCKLSPNADGKVDNDGLSTISGMDVHALEEDHDYNGKWETVTVGESVIFGQLLYKDWAATEWKLAKADAAATTPAMRIALESASDGDTCIALVQGQIRDDSAFQFTASIGYLSDATAGAILYAAPSDAGDQVQRVGIGISADIMDFCPSIDVGEI